MRNFLTALTLLIFAGACSTQGNIFSLGVGQCFADDSIGAEVTDVDIVDCAKPHFNEIFALPELPDGDFPGSALAEESLMLCLDHFDSYVGLAYPQSIYEVNLLHPSQKTWDKGDREVVCYLFDLNGETKTDTARSSGR